jgi:hypothetical protein
LKLGEALGLIVRKLLHDGRTDQGANQLLMMSDVAVTDEGQNEIVKLKLKLKLNCSSPWHVSEVSSSTAARS